MSVPEPSISPTRRLRTAPELVWPGKAAIVVPAGASLHTAELVGVERTVAADSTNHAWYDRLIWGDNLAAMAALLAEYAGQVALIYADPPFGTGTTYVQRVPLGVAAGRGATRVLRAPAYSDAWGAGRASYLQMLYERLTLMHMLLANGGALYVHVDPTVAPYVRLILDEIFGEAGFQREIVWRIGWVSGYKSAVANWVRNHDTILYYTKGRPAVFNKEYLPQRSGYRRRGGIGAGRGYPIEDVWNANPAEFGLSGVDSLDSIQIKSFSMEKTGFPTQKNESLLRRIVRASSRPGDLVADFFCGSGTTLVAAAQLGRRWIGCDAGWRAVHTTRKRLLGEPATRRFLLQRTDCSVLPGPWQAVPAEAIGGRGRRLRLDVRVSEGSIVVRLDDYRPGGGRWQVRGGGKAEGIECVDYWAVDFDYDGRVFRDTWRSFRGRGQGELRLRSAAHYCAEGVSRRIAVKAVDVFGEEALSVVEIASTR